MSRNTGVFPDVVDVLKELIREWYPELRSPTDDEDSDFRVGRVFPEDLQSKLPYVRLSDIGGNDDGLTDFPLIDVDVFHRTFDEARALAYGIRGWLLGGPHTVSGVATLDKAITAMRPHTVPWDDDRVARFYGSYTIGARRAP